MLTVGVVLGRLTTLATKHLVLQLSNQQGGEQDLTSLRLAAVGLGRAVGPCSSRTLVQTRFHLPPARHDGYCTTAIYKGSSAPARHRETVLTALRPIDFPPGASRYTPSALLNPLPTSAWQKCPYWSCCPRTPGTEASEESWHVGR